MDSDHCDIWGTLVILGGLWDEMAGWDMGVEWEDVWEFPGQFYRGTVQSQGVLYNPMGHRGLMGLRGSLTADLDMTDKKKHYHPSSLVVSIPLSVTIILYMYYYY